MKYITKLKLATVHQICDSEDKSTEFMLQLMQDACDVDLDAALSYMEKTSDYEKKQLFTYIMSFNSVFLNIESIVPHLLN